MATTDPQGLLNLGKCFACFAPLSEFQTMKLALLAQLSTTANASNDVTPQGLMTAGYCYNCYGSLSMFEIMEMVLLKQIAGG